MMFHPCVLPSGYYRNSMIDLEVLFTCAAIN